MENRIQTEHGQLIFDVLFTLQDQIADYASLQPTQLFNHFPGNKCLTTKSGLAKTLNGNGYPQLHLDEWMPRCFDLTESGGVEDLIDAIERTAVTLLLQRSWTCIGKDLKASIEREHAAWKEIEAERYNVGFRK